MHLFSLQPSDLNFNSKVLYKAGGPAALAVILSCLWAQCVLQARVWNL